MDKEDIKFTTINLQKTIKGLVWILYSLALKYLKFHTKKIVILFLLSFISIIKVLYFLIFISFKLRKS